MPTGDELGLTQLPNDAPTEWFSAAVSVPDEEDAGGSFSPAPSDNLSWLMPGSSQSAGAPAVVTPGASGAPADSSQPAGSALDWESEQNPYKRQAQQGPSAGQRLQTQRTQNAREAQSAVQMLVANGMDEQAANAVAASALAAANAQAELTITREVTAQPAKLAVAQQISKQYSTPQFPITPEMLQSESTPQGMEAVARTLANGARAGAFQTRVANRVDRVEVGAGVSGGSAVDERGLSPFELIRSGLKSSRNHR